MSLETEIYEAFKDVNRNWWNDFIEQLKLNSFFHRFEWLKVERGITLNYITF